jgi:uncharacterized protein YdcH (DUF465 family)
MHEPITPHRCHRHCRFRTRPADSAGRGRRPLFPPPHHASQGTGIPSAAAARTTARRWLMFESNPKQIESLLSANEEFRTLYQRHKELDKKVLDAELGVLPLDDDTLTRMKKEKLRTKDRLFRLYESQAQATAH